MRLKSEKLFIKGTFLQKSLIVLLLFFYMSLMFGYEYISAEKLEIDILDPIEQTIPTVDDLIGVYAEGLGSGNDDVWAATSTGLIFRSLDSGETWTQELDTETTLRRMDGANGKVYVVGDDYHVWEYDGISWNQFTSLEETGSDQLFYNVHAYSETSVWFVGGEIASAGFPRPSKVIFYDGSTLQELNISTEIEDRRVHSVYQSSETEVWLGLEGLASTGSIVEDPALVKGVYNTIEEQWEFEDVSNLINPNSSAWNTYDIYFFDEIHGVLIGNEQTSAPVNTWFAYTDDGGSSWTVDKSDPFGSFIPATSTVRMFDETEIWAVTTGGGIHKSNDAGNSWEFDSFTSGSANFTDFRRFLVDEKTIAVRQGGQVFINDDSTVEVSPALSSAEATSPHLPNGIDASTLSIDVRDLNDEPIENFTEGDFSFYVLGNASVSFDAETAPGVYEFSVTNNSEESATIEITVDGVVLDDMPSITFTNPFAGGTGIMDDPLQVETPEQLDAVRDYSGQYFIQIADIDLDGYGHFLNGWIPINTFNGAYFGDGFTISNLTIDNINQGQAGLFGWIEDGAVIDDVTIIDADINAQQSIGILAGRNNGEILNSTASGVVHANFTGSVSPAGGLVGVNADGGRIENSHSNADVSSVGSMVGGIAGWNNGSEIISSSASGSVKGSWKIGGLVGENNNGSIIVESSSSAVVSFEDQGGTNDGSTLGGLVGNNNGSTIQRSFSTGNVSGSRNIGGLVGFNAFTSIIDESYASGNVSVSTGGDGDFIGGLVGENRDSEITNSYALGSVTGNNFVGGLVGSNDSSFTGGPGTIESSFATGTVSGNGAEVGGLVGEGVVNVSNSFWDIFSTQQDHSPSGTRKTTFQLQSIDSYTVLSDDLNTAWDFDITWGINPSQNNGYPFLRWQDGVTHAPLDGSTPALLFSEGLIELVSGEDSLYTVQLNTIPETQVTVTISSDNPDDVTLNGLAVLTLTFEPDATALDPQTVSVSTEPDGTGSEELITINHSLDSAAYSTPFDSNVGLFVDFSEAIEPEEPTPEEVDVIFSDLTISDTSIYSGMAVSITATVENIDEMDGFFEAGLFVDGSEVQVITETIEQGQISEIEFLYHFSEPGNYNVRIENLDNEPVIVNAAWAQNNLNADNNATADFLTGPKTDQARIKWETEVNATVTGAPTIADGVIYYGTFDNHMYASELETGQVIWSTDTGDRIRSSPALTDSLIISGNSNGDVFAINRSTGDYKWNRNLGSIIWASPKLAGDVVYITTHNSEEETLFALDVQTGNTLWIYNLGSSSSSSPAIANGTIFVGSNDNHLYAIDATGSYLNSENRLLWKFETSNSLGNSDPVFHDDVIYFKSGNTLYAVEASSGDEIWSKTLSGMNIPNPVVSDGVIYVGSQGGIFYALNATDGEEIWTFEPEIEFGSINLLNANPTLADGVVYFSSGGNTNSNRRFYGLEATTGDIVIRFDDVVTVTTRPTIFDGIAYVGLQGRGVFAIRETVPEDFIADSQLSSVNATSPHWADGLDESVVEILVRNEFDDPIDDLESEDFEITFSGNAVASDVVPYSTNGRYRFNVTSNTSQILNVTVSVKGVPLDDQPEIEFFSTETNWSVVNVDILKSSLDVNTVHFLNEDTGWLLGGFEGDGFGDETQILKTNDGGETWTEQYYSEDFVMLDLFFVNDQKGWAAGYSNVVLHTNDGGETWIEQPVGEINVYFNALFFSDENNGWVTGGDFVYKTENGGQTWTAQNLIRFMSARDIYFTDSETGWVGGFNDPGIVKTIDGGSNWVPDADTSRIEGITFLDEQSGFAVGWNGLVLRTVDSGNVWEPLPSGTDENLFAVSFSDENSGWIVGRSGTILSTADGGNSWEREYPGTSDNIMFRDVQFLNSEKGWATGRNGTVLKYEIEREDPQPVVDASNSSVSATSPHIADGEEEALVTITVISTQGDTLSGMNSEEFVRSISGTGILGNVTETDNPGIYSFTVASAEVQTVTVSVSVMDTLLADSPQIEFIEPDEPVDPIVQIDPDSSSVTATSPHFADGNDESLVSIRLRNSNGNSITGVDTENINVSVSSNAATAGEVSEINGTGEYRVGITSTLRGEVTITITIDEFELSEKPVILFEPDPIVDQDSSTVIATSPHLASGQDSTTVTINLKNSNGEEISGFSEEDFTINLSGAGVIAETISETDTPGTYRFYAVSNTPGESQVTIIADNVEITDKPVILFEPVAEPIPNAPEFISISRDEQNIILNWSVDSEEFIGEYIIYKGDKVHTLAEYDTLTAGTLTFTETDIPTGTTFYSIAAVNNDGEQGDLSNILSYVNDNVTANENWQLSSIPLGSATVETDIATIFGFASNYKSTETMEPEKGYWVKTKSFETELIPASGVGLDSMSVTLSAGWNLIGSLSDTVSVNNINDLDGILTEAPVFAYTNNQYEEANHIVPGSGYWVFAGDSGRVTLSVYTENSESEEDVDLMVSEMSVLDDLNGSTTLYFRTEQETAEILLSDIYLSEDEKSRFLMPPIAPEPTLDVRTSEHTRVMNNEPTRIELRSTQFPVQVEVEGFEENYEFAYRLTVEKEGVQRAIDLVPGQPNILSEEYDYISLEKIHVDELITEHRLMPNYPNPFNPTTTIHYQLREQSEVRIEVYDVIGRRVQVLANETQFSGEYRVNFDARNLASGIYIIRFIAGNHMDIRKMTLIK